MHEGDFKFGHEKPIPIEAPCTPVKFRPEAYRPVSETKGLQ